MVLYCLTVLYQGIILYTSSNLGVQLHLEKMNEGFYTAKVDGQEFHLRSSHIAEVLEVLDDEDKTYFDNIQMENFLESYSEVDEIIGTTKALGTSFTDHVCNSPAQLV